MMNRRCLQRNGSYLVQGVWRKNCVVLFQSSSISASIRLTQTTTQHYHLHITVTRANKLLVDGHIYPKKSNIPKPKITFLQKSRKLILHHSLAISMQTCSPNRNVAKCPTFCKTPSNLLCHILCTRRCRAIHRFICSRLYPWLTLDSQCPYFTVIQS